jgi:glutamate synthase (NADPH/NADH) small chain
MSTPSNLSPGNAAKYAWAAIARQSLPKRSAAERTADFREIYGDFDAATAQAQASRCVQCPDPSCVQGCLLANRIPEWLALVAEGKFLEAAEVSRATSNLPEICARVCPQDCLCEGSCILNSRSEPVAIGAIERFISDYAFAYDAVELVQAPPNGRRVAVVGAGPGGLACADELAKLGYAVTVFEALSVPGGLLVHGIPAFKLDKSIVARRVDFLRRRGVEFRLGVRIGWDLDLAGLRRNFDAVYLSPGAQRAKALDVPGADLEGVLPALPFLRQKNTGGADGFPHIEVTGRRVVVLGGGDTAMDCLRTALRCGASSATCLYRRDEENMPGSRKEYANSLEEGARFEFLVGPVALEGDSHGRVVRVRCIEMELGARDASGRRKPQPVPGSEFNVAADLVLVAYGFDPVPFPAGSDFAQIATDKWGGLAVDENQMTSMPGVFAGGDAARGPSLVGYAVRDARRAAAAIDRYLFPGGK